MVINFQSIKNKKAEVSNLLDAADADIIIGTETWLRPDIKSAEIFPATYSIYRKDRKDGYGGVLLAVKEDIISEELKMERDIEAVFAKLSIPGIRTWLIVGSLYRPPSSDINYMESLCEEVINQANKHRSSILWMGGDLNLPDINWRSEAVIGNRNASAINAKFLEMIRDCNLEQMVDYPTRLDVTLDLFLTNGPTLINRSQPLPGISDHDDVLIDSSLKPTRNKPTSRKTYVWKRADIPNMILGAESINGGTRTHKDDINQSTPTMDNRGSKEAVTEKEEGFYKSKIHPRPKRSPEISETQGYVQESVQTGTRSISS